MANEILAEGILAEDILAKVSNDDSNMQKGCYRCIAGMSMSSVTQNSECNEYKNRGPTGGAQDNEGPIGGHSKSKRPEGSSKRGPVARKIQYR